MRRQFYRRMAAGRFGLATVVVIATVGFTQAPAPVVVRDDPVATRDLVALMRAGERGSWSVKYKFTRTLADGRSLEQPMQEARDPALHVLRSGSAMSVDQGHRSYDCTLAGPHVECIASAAATVLPPSEVLRVAVSTGAYAVIETPTATIAGERARCFRVVTTGHGELPDLGVEADLCLGASGVSLRQRVVSASGNVDERLAESVTEHVTTSVVRAVARGFDPNTATSGG